MIKNVDFRAKLVYLPAEEGGRKSYVTSGYRPQLKFDFIDIQTSGSQEFIGGGKVFPGETIIAEITMGSTILYQGKLVVGMHFGFYEGELKIGNGTITQITNDVLKRGS